MVHVDYVHTRTASIFCIIQEHVDQKDFSVKKAGSLLMLQPDEEKHLA